MALGTDPTEDDGDLSKYAGTLFGSRYIHFWLLRHLHLQPDQLTEVLAKAIDVSRAVDRGVVLPEVPRQETSAEFAGSGPATTAGNSSEDQFYWKAK